jgi:hypothetical protein
MEDIEDFFEHYRPRLLLHLDGRVDKSSAEPGSLEFVDEVLDRWEKFSQARSLEMPAPPERVFWYALYQLEDLVEFPATGQPDPYEVILMQNLAEVREILRYGGDLPDGLYATRPGEEPGAF